MLLTFITVREFQIVTVLKRFQIVIEIDTGAVNNPMLGTPNYPF
jgi:hypothetical protein